MRRAGIEPATTSLKGSCSTTELPAQGERPRLVYFRLAASKTFSTYREVRLKSFSRHAPKLATTGNVLFNSHSNYVRRISDLEGFEKQKTPAHGGPRSCHAAEAAFALHRHRRPHEAHGEPRLTEGSEPANLQEPFVQERRNAVDGSGTKDLERVALHTVPVNCTRRTRCRVLGVLRLPEVDERGVEVADVVEVDLRIVGVVASGDLGCEEFRDERTSRSSSELT